MYIDAATKVLYRTPVQNLPQPISLQLVCNSRSVQKLLYRSCCTEAPIQKLLYRGSVQDYTQLFEAVQNVCTERLYRSVCIETSVQNACTEAPVQRFSVLLFI